MSTRRRNPSCTPFPSFILFSYSMLTLLYFLLVPLTTVIHMLPLLYHQGRVKRDPIRFFRRLFPRGDSTTQRVHIVLKARRYQRLLD